MDQRTLDQIAAAAERLAAAETELQTLAAQAAAAPHPNVHAIARAARVTPQTVYRWKKAIVTKTHPYFVAKAREVFADASGDPDLAGPLAAWAETARHRDPQPHGVIVGEDGTLLAETKHVSGNGWGATYVETALVPSAQALVGQEVGLAVAGCRHEIGQPAIEVRASQVCYGAGEFIRQV